MTLIMDLTIKDKSLIISEYLTTQVSNIYHNKILHRKSENNRLISSGWNGFNN